MLCYSKGRNWPKLRCNSLKLHGSELGMAGEMADLKTWGAVLDHPFYGSSLPCLSLVVHNEAPNSELRSPNYDYQNLLLHVLLLPDGFILVKIQECAYQYEGDPYYSDITAVQVAEGKFRQSKGVASIEIIWTGCRWCELIESQDPNQEYDSGWRADRQVPIKTELPLPGRPLSGLPLPLTLGDSNGRLNVAELCEAWRKADRRWISKCCN